MLTKVSTDLCGMTPQLKYDSKGSAAQPTTDGNRQCCCENREQANNKYSGDRTYESFVAPTDKKGSGACRGRVEMHTAVLGPAFKTTLDQLREFAPALFEKN